MTRKPGPDTVDLGGATLTAHRPTGGRREARAAAGEARAHTREWLLGISIVALAAAMRAWGLARFPFEQDEVYTIWEARDLFAVHLEPGIEARPLFFLLQHALFGVLPPTHVGLRLLPFLLGVAGVWAAWAIGRRLFGETTGLVAAFLAAISPWHLHASGMARYWTLLFLLAAGFYYFLARAYQDDRRRDHLAALAALVLGAATHPTLLFPAAGAALGATLVTREGAIGWRWPSRRAWLLLWGPFALFLAGAYLALRLTGSEEAVRNWGGRGWLASLRLVPAMVDWTTPTLTAAALLGAALLLAGRHPLRRRWGAMTALGCATAVGGLWAASWVTNVYADYAVSMLPLVLVTGAAPVQLAAERMWGGARAAAWGGACLLAAGVLPVTLSHLASGTRFDYRPAFRHVRATAPGVEVLTWPLILQRHYAPDLRAEALTTNTGRLDSILARERDLWVVSSVRRYGIVSDDDGRLARWLTRHCTLETAHEKPRWDYRMYRVELHRCHAAGAEPGAPPVARPQQMNRTDDIPASRTSSPEV